MRKLAKWIKHQNQRNMPEYEVVIQETVKNWYKNKINQESGDSWLASHMVNCDLSQPSVKDTTMIPKWLIIRCWNPRWWNSTVHANNVNSLGNKHSSIATDADLKTNTFSSLTVHSSPLLSSPILSFIPCTCLLSACLCCGHQVETSIMATNISEKRGGRMFCHNAGNHEQPYTALHPRPNKHH